MANRELFGDLVDEPAFTEPYLAALDSLHTHGARATLEALAGIPRGSEPLRSQLSVCRIRSPTARYSDALGIAAGR